jgi:hypothetical protein
MAAAMLTYSGEATVSRNGRSVTEPAGEVREFYDTLHAILTNMRARFLQQRGNAPVAIATLLTGQLGDRLCQCIFVGSIRRLVALCSAPLSDQPARVPFTHPMLLACVLNCGPTSLGA